MESELDTGGSGSAREEGYKIEASGTNGSGGEKAVKYRARRHETHNQHQFFGFLTCGHPVGSGSA